MINGQLKYLILHCTATKEGIEVSSNTIRKWHLSKPPVGRGWNQVGYSDMIHLNGVIENLVKYNDDDWVDNWEVTNGVAGYNSISRHVVYVGGVDKFNKPKDTRTPEQKKSLIDYVLKFIKIHPSIEVAGHYHFAAKACPSFNVEQFCREIGVPEINIYKKK